MSEWLFRNRGWLPVPLIAAAVLFAEYRSAYWLRGLFVMFAGEGIRLWAAAHIGPAARTSRPLDFQLITTGPYAHMRHPLYFGNFLLTLGFVTASGAFWPWAVLGVGVMFLIVYVHHAKREERLLAQTFGDRWRDYVSRVPFLMPRLTPASVEPAGDFESPSLKRAFLTERWTIHAELWLILVLWLRHFKS